MSSMTYSEFLDVFIEGLRKCVAWATTIFTGNVSSGGLGSVIFSNHFIFTIMMISILCFITEEIVGVLTMFRLGGFVFRRFSSRYNSGYKVNYETEYPKSYDVDYSQEHFGIKMNPRYRQKYFIKYDGKYYPFRHSRYNPLYARQFNSAYKAGRIVSYSEMYGQRMGSLNAGSSHSSYNTSYGNSFNPDGLKKAFKWGSDLAQNAYDIYKDYKNKNEPLGEGISSNPNTVSSGTAEDGTVQVEGLYTGRNGFDNFNGTEDTYTTSEGHTFSSAGRNFNTGEEQLESGTYDMNDYGGISYEDSE